MLAAMIAHALRDHPHEACGLVGGHGELACEVRALSNVASDPRTRYLMHPREQLAAFEDFEAKGWEVVAIYHSHPHGPARPSETDIAESYYPDVVYLIISLADREMPEVTAWLIEEGQVTSANWESLDG